MFMGDGTNTPYANNLTFIPALVFTSDLEERTTCVHIMAETVHVMAEAERLTS